jgi:hypothetical protein
VPDIPPTTIANKRNNKNFIASLHTYCVLLLGVVGFAGNLAGLLAG